MAEKIVYWDCGSKNTLEELIEKSLSDWRLDSDEIKKINSRYEKEGWCLRNTTASKLKKALDEI